MSPTASASASASAAPPAAPAPGAAAAAVAAGSDGSQRTTSLEPLPQIAHGRNFEVKLVGIDLVVGFFTQITGFSAQVDVFEYAEGGRNDFVHRLPGHAKQGNITLKRGVTSEKALLDWFKKTVTEVQPVDLSIALYDTNSVVVQTWSFSNAYPIKWSGTDLNSGGTEFLTESLEIAHNGMYSVV